MSSIRSLSWQIGLLVGALALLVATIKLVDWAVQYLWFEHLGYTEVFWTLRALKVGTFGAAFAVAFLYLWLNFRLLAGATARVRGEDPRRRVRTPVLFKAAALAIALVGALAVAAGWDTVLRYLWSRPYGVADPVYGRDVGFYLFELPFLEVAQNALLALFFLGSAMTVWTYATAGVWSFDWARGITAPAPVRRHVAVNVALLLLALAWGYYLDRFALLQSEEGAVYGAGYTDVHVTRPALWLAMAATLGLAAAALTPAVHRRAGLAAGLLGGYLLVLFGGLILIPWGVQAFRVEPNELELERAYLEHNIAFTRRAFGLQQVDERAHPETTSLGLGALERNRETVENIRLWDWGPLRRTFRQLQQIRTYYEFHEVDVDRYDLDGRYRQVMLAARELSGDLPGGRDTWVNRRLQYTHGYGLVMSLAAEKSEQGGPVLLVKDLPPKTGEGLALHKAAVYYGETMRGYRIVSTSVKEFDYPRGDDNVYTRYDGRGGVRLDAYWKRLLFGLHELEASIVLSGYVDPDSRIQLWRRLRERVERVAPFLRLDADPYPVASGGRLYWIQDAYTTATSFPYSEPYEGTFNYIRNSVKVVVDAYDGTVTFHVVDPDDPILRVYQAAFPGLFRTLEEMPANLRAHLRYPQDLFQAQVAQYNTYHMTVPQVFYNREDVWEVPWEKFGGEQLRMKPYYVLMKLPQEERLQFLLMMPLTPNNRDNMIAWMAARSDFPGYGDLIVYKLPKERLIVGPMQVEAMIDQDTHISQRLSLWDQRGSRVMRGNLLVIPIEQSFLYVEPVFLIAEGTDLPQLKRLIASNGDRLAMEPTLDEALRVVYSGRERPPREAAEPRPRALSAAREALEAARAALREGDWAAFAQAMRELERELLQESPPE